MKPKQIFACISSVALASSVSACASDVELPPEPTDDLCSNWEWDYSDGVYECDDYNSSHYSHYYYGGTYFPSKSSLKKSSAYKKYQSNSSFKGSSGFGKGSSNFGG